MADPTLEELLDRWQRSGGTLLPADLCRDCPHLLAGLLGCIQDLPTTPAARPPMSAIIDRGNAEARSPGIVPDKLPAIAGYTLIRKLGAGGQGSVYLATHPESQRKVAIKVLLDSPYGSDAAKRRFGREVDIVASLRHPNIVAVLHAGITDDGHPFYEMDYVPGVPITDYARDNKLRLEEILDLFNTACQAVNHAHQKGVIHRDLKPANILVDDGGGVHILDFGLAKQISDAPEPLVSFTGMVMGTLPYMSPEQSQGNPDNIDIRTDVYALGVILYQLLTGSYPYPVARNMAEVLKNFAQSDPRAPTRTWTKALGVGSSSRRRAPDKCPITDEVETIALKAISKERERRYQSAGELGRDVLHYLRDEPIEAKRDSGVYLLRKTLARHRVPAAMAVLFVVFLAVASVSLWFLRNEAARQRDVARTASREAVTQRDLAVAAEAREADARRAAEQSHLTSLVSDGAYLLGAGKPREGRAALDQALDLLPQTTLSPLGITAPLLAATDRFVIPLSYATPAAASPTRCVALSPDGRIMLVGADDHSLALWDVRTATVIRTLEGDAALPVALAFSPDGQTALVARADRSLKLWTLATGKPLRALARDNAVSLSLAFSPDGHTALAGRNDNTLRLWNIDSGEAIRTLTVRGGAEIHSVAFSPDGHTALSSSFDNALRLWNLDTGQNIRTFTGHKADTFLWSAALSPDGRTALSASGDGTIKLWNVATNEVIRTFSGHSAGVISAVFSHDGSKALSAGLDHTFKVWDVASGAELCSLAGEGDDMPVGAAFSPDGRFAIASTRNQPIIVWDLSAAKNAHQLLGHTDAVNHVTFSQDGRLAASASDRTLVLWDVATHQKIREFPATTRGLRAIAFADDDRTLRLFRGDGTLLLLDTNTAARRSYRLPSVNTAAFSPDGTILLAAGDDQSLRAYDASTGEVLRQFPMRRDLVSALAFSPDGGRALAVDASSASVWDVSAGALVKAMPGVAGGALSVALSPDGSTALLAGDALRSINTGTGGRFTFPDRAALILDARYSPDGQYVLTANAGNTITLWDARAAREVQVFDAGKVLGQLPDVSNILQSQANDPDGLGRPIIDKTAQIGGPLVYSVAWSPDGWMAISGSSDSTVNLWDFSAPLRYHDFQRELPAARLALAKDPNDAAALLTFGRWYAFRGINDFAAEFFERSAGNGGAVSPLDLAQCHFRLNRRPEALTEYQKAQEDRLAPEAYLQILISSMKQ